MIEKTRKYSDSEVATQHNHLINSQQSLSVIQKRIFYLAIAQIKKGDKDYKRYYVDLSDVGSSQSIYHQVSSEIRNLMGKTIQFPGEMNGKETMVYLNLISKAEHLKNTGKIYIDLHPDIRDMLLDLKKFFTKVPVIELLACRSTYGQRLYELLYQFSDTGVRLIEVDKLKEILSVKEKYKNFSHFRKYVLEQAQQDVEKHTNMSFTWQELKATKGRKIERLMFDIKVSDPEQTELEFNVPKWDMSKHKALQKNLREICEFSESNVKKVLRHLDKSPDDKQVFHQLIHKTELRVKDGEDGKAKPLGNVESWALTLFEKTISNFNRNN